MAILSKEAIKDYSILPVSEYAKQCGGVTTQAIYAAMYRTDKLDYVRLGHAVFVVLTDKTLKYSPNNSLKRGVKGNHSIMQT